MSKKNSRKKGIKRIPKKKAPTTKSSSSASTLLPTLLEKYGVLFILGVVALLAIVVFKDFLLYSSVYLFQDIGSDSINIVYPRIVHLADYIREEGFPGWSFNQGMGQNIYPYALSDPFSVLQFLFGRGGIPYGFAIIECIKILLTSVFFFYYLRTLSLSHYSSLLGTLIFSFSGFMILGGGWWVFSAQAFQASILLLGLEHLYQKKTWLTLTIAIFLIGADMPVNLFLFAQFILLYTIFRFIGDQGWKPKELVTHLFKIAFFSTLGVALSSVFLFANTQEILQSPRVDGESSLFAQLLEKGVFATETTQYYATEILRFFSSDILGSGSNFRGALNYLEAPMFYISLPVLLLFPQLLAHSTTQKRILYTIPLIMILVVLIFPFFRYAFWGFSGNYFRTISLFISLAFLFYAMRALEKVEEKGIHLPVLVITLVALLGLLYFPYHEALKAVTVVHLQTTIAILLVLYTVLLGLSKFIPQKGALQIGLLLVLCVELAYFASITANNRDLLTRAEYKKGVLYEDKTIDAVKYLKENDNSFFRVHKNYSSGGAVHRSMNDAKVQNFRGTSSYHSFNQKYYIEFLQTLGVIDGKNESQTRWAPGVGARPLLEIFSSVKYKLLKPIEGNLNAGFGYTQVSTFGDVTLFKNNNVLPFGFAYDQYLPLEEFKKLNQVDKEVALFRAVVIADEQKPQFSSFKQLNTADLPNGQEYNGTQLGADLNQRKAMAFNLESHSQNKIKGSIKLAKKSVLFFTIPYDKGWTARVNGVEKNLEKMNVGFTGLMLEAGEHQVELSYFPPLVLPGLAVSLVALLLLLYLFKRRRRFLLG